MFYRGTTYTAKLVIPCKNLFRVHKNLFRLHKKNVQEDFMGVSTPVLMGWPMFRHSLETFLEGGCCCGDYKRMRAHHGGILAFCDALAERRTVSSVLWWTRRGSNPRPNREPPSFLHAYPCLYCRATPRPRPPSAAVSSKISTLPRGRQTSIPDIPAPPYQAASEKERLGDVSSPHIVGRDKADLLYFNQAARA